MPSAPAVGASLVPGLEALMASLQARGQHAYDQIAAGWLGGAADSFFSGVDVLAGRSRIWSTATGRSNGSSC